jgi:hypothetical protein
MCRVASSSNFCVVYVIAYANIVVHKIKIKQKTNFLSHVVACMKSLSRKIKNLSHVVCAKVVQSQNRKQILVSHVIACAKSLIQKIKIWCAESHPHQILRCMWTHARKVWYINSVHIERLIRAVQAMMSGYVAHARSAYAPCKRAGHIHESLKRKIKIWVASSTQKSYKIKNRKQMFVPRSWGRMHDISCRITCYC